MSRALVAVGLAMLVTLEVGVAAPRDGGKGERGGRDASAADPLADAVGDEHGAGQVNPLDVSNPVCDGSLGSRQRRNCVVTGTPEGRYPTSNYAIDIHIDTGIDNIVGNFQNLLAQLANAIWIGLLFVLNLVLTLLGWAFELSPFTDNPVMSEVSGGLERFYRAFTSPFFVVAIAFVGAWGVWGGLVRREFTQAIAGTILTLALMLAGLWILHEPRATVGTVAELTNEAALGVIAAPQEGSFSNPQSSYAEATEEVWQAMTLPGFAAMNFSDMGWALSEPDAELLAKADESACKDYAYLRQLSPRVLRQLAAQGGDVDCAEVAAAAPAPRTNAEIWLRSSAGSEARQSLWDEFTDDFPYSSHFAIQGDGGAWTRLPLVCLIALGLLGGIALLAWLALRIFVQTAVAFVLVLATPVALFLPAFGERGRAAFAFWGGTLAGALISKLVYAALLAIVLFATTVIAGAVPEGAGAFMAFLVMAGLWWAVFLKRDDILSFLSVGDDEGGSGTLGKLGGIYAARSVARSLGGALGVTGRVAKGAVGATAGGVGSFAGDRAEGTRRTARSELDRQAEKRLGARYGAEKATLSEQAERRGRLARLAGQRSDALKEARRHAQGAKSWSSHDRARHLAARDAALDRAQTLRGAQGKLRDEIAANGAKEARARAFVGDADERQRASGARFGEREIGEARDAIRREADRPVSDPAHAWRLGMSPERYAAISGREREQARAEVTRQLRADGIAFGAISNRPPGLVRAREREKHRRQVRARGREGHRELREARRQAARGRRVRRGVSR